MANGEVIQLAENAAAGNGTAMNVQGGKYGFTVEATFGGGSGKLQLQLSQGGYADITGSTLSAAGVVNLDLVPGMYRFVGATGSAFYARLIKIGNT